MRRRVTLIGALAVGLVTLVIALAVPRAPQGAVLDPLWAASEILDRTYGDDVSRGDLIDGAATALSLESGTAGDVLAIENQTGAPSDVPDGFEPLWSVWQAAATGIRTQDAPDLVEVAIRGMVAATGDPRARVVTGDHQGDVEYFDDEQTGIGALVTAVGDQMVISQPFPGGPADRAGARPGDVIVSVDGRPASADQLGLVVDRLRGDAGSSVVVVLDRAGAGELEITIVRDVLPLTSAGTQGLDSENVGYVHVTRFAADTPELVVEHLRQLGARGAQALIIDLRGNSDGRLSSALTLADQFVDGGLGYVAEDLDGSLTQHQLNRGGLAVEVPLALLVDERTAGPAELYAAVMQDHRRAAVFGMPTAGDTALHRPHQIADDLALVVHDGQWHAPSGPLTMIDGVQPDAEIPLFDEDVAAGYDRQIYAAYSFLWQWLGGPVEAGVG